MRSWRARLGGDSGQSLIEFAMVTPMLVVLAMGVIETGNAIYDQHIVTKLTREGSNLISRDVTLQDAAQALRSMGAAPIDFGTNSKVIFSVIKRGETTGTTNYDKMILYQRYEFGALAASSRIGTKGGGSFGAAPNYEATNSDSNGSLQVTGVPTNLVGTKGGLIYVTEIFTRHTLLTPLDRFGIPFPTTLYSIAYF